MIVLSVFDGPSETSVNIEFPDDPSAYVKPVFKGDATLKNELISYLEDSAGLYGTTIDPKLATAIDVYAALQSKTSPYALTVLKGQKQLDSFQVDLPEGVMP
jgi:hypothetical protein